MTNRIYRMLRFDWPLHFVLFFTNWLPDNGPFLRLRGLLASPFFGTCAENLRLGRNLTFYNPSKIQIGKDVYIAQGGWFMAGTDIIVGDQVLFGPYCVVVSSNHSLSGKSYRYGEAVNRPITIGFGTWIASHVTIAAGAEIGEGVLVAANSVVSKSIMSGVVCGGVPAKIISRDQNAV